MGDVVVGLDIGTSKICAIVGEVRPDDIYVIGVGIEPSQGMSRGAVTELPALAESISAAVHKAEKTSGYQIGRAYVSVAGGHITSLTSRGMTPIPNSRSIRPDDLERAMEAARAIAIPHNREILHVIPRSYTLDGQEGVRNPVGMHCFRLEVDAHIITASSTSLSNIEQAVENAGMYVDCFVLNPLAAGDAVLTDKERRMGTVVIDIGGGTTDIAIFVDDTVWHTAVVPVAGDLITNDITHWINVDNGLAERIKIQHGHATRQAVNSLEMFLVEPFGDSLPQEVARHDLALVIEARVEEIFELVHQDIKRSGYGGLLRAGAVITGGVAQTPGIADVARRVLDRPVRIAAPEGMTGLADGLRSPSFSTSVGLLRTGLAMRAVQGLQDPANGGALNLGNLIGGFFRRLLPDDRE
jgi:cell division protein FtsA